MSFLLPWALAGLVAAAVPIILHLVQRREPPTVVFPAVRYLLDATREHQRRLRVQHWLLLAVRTLLVVALVLAAAGPLVARAGVATHAPAALVLVLDNSASSAAVSGGTRRLDELAAAADEALRRAGAGDALWLLTADGVPRRGDAEALRRMVRELAPVPQRLDLGAAIRTADEVLAGEERPGEILLLTDAQATAIGPASPRVPLVVGRPATAPPRNAGLAAVDAGAQPWSVDGGRVTLELAGDTGMQVPAAVRLGERPARQALATVGTPVTLSLPGVPAGWHTLVAELGADELRLDDRRVAAVRVAPVARADCAAAGRYAQAACEVLAANGRLASGGEVRLGGFGAAASVVLPPEDAAEVGALNRELARRGVPWRFGPPAVAGVTDSGPLLPAVRVTKRLRLEAAGSGRTGVLASVNGEPWLVRAGTVLLLGSRLDPAWTELPVTAGFIRFVDRLANRLSRGELAALDAAPGDPVPLPDQVDAVLRGDVRTAVEGGARFAAADTGLHYLVSGRDTVGVLAVNPDPRESRLAPALDGQLRDLWRGARVEDLEEAGGLAFANASRSDFTGPFLWLALVLGLVEVALASWWRKKA
ncbi:MAG TPA: BatA domain-containing protein [Gemmatimonadales bacterium]|nr:BatA domain-containing protein [Gemmatimonadales bacterium]